MPGRSALCSLMLVCAAAASALTAARAMAQADVADLHEDVRGLTQRVNELTLRIEQIEHENSQIRAKLSGYEGSRDQVTTAQLNAAVADLNSSIRSAVAASREQILEKVATQMENLAKQTNAALDSVGKAGPAAQPHPAAQEAAAKAAFGDSYSREGTHYTVQKGDTLGLIAKKTGAKSQDIIDANKLLDPSRIQAGQVLFIPGGK